VSTGEKTMGVVAVCLLVVGLCVGWLVRGASVPAPSCPPPTVALDLADYNGRQADRALAIAEHMVGVYRRCCDEEPVSRCCVAVKK